MNYKKINDTRNTIFNRTSLFLTPWLENIDDVTTLNEDIGLLTDLGLDSVAILQLIQEIEKQFNISIQDYELDMEVLSRLGNLIDLIEGKMNEADRSAMAKPHEMS